MPDSHAPNDTARPSLLMVSLCLAAIYVVWGTTYLAIRIGLQELRPFFMLGTRLVVAGGGFLLVLMVLGTRLPTRNSAGSRSSWTATWPLPRGISNMR